MSYGLVEDESGMVKWIFKELDAVERSDLKFGVELWVLLSLMANWRQV